MGQVAVFSGPDRRRRWSDEERLSILAEAFAPVPSSRCRAAPGCFNLADLYLAAQVAGGERRAGAGRAGDRVRRGGDDRGWRGGQFQRGPAIVADLARGRRISIFASTSPAQVTAALKALR